MYYADGRVNVRVEQLANPLFEEKMKRDEILKAIDAILDGEQPIVNSGEWNNGVPYLYLRNPNYDPEIQGEAPALVIDFRILKRLLTRSEEK